MSSYRLKTPRKVWFHLICKSLLILTWYSPALDLWKVFTSALFDEDQHATVSEGGPGGLVPWPEGPRHQGLGDCRVVHQGLGRSSLQGGHSDRWRRGRGPPPALRSEVVTADVSDLLPAQRPCEVGQVADTDRPLWGRHHCHAPCCPVAWLRLQASQSH